MSPVSITNFTICRTCAGLAGSPVQGSYPQVCRCHRREQGRWPHRDFNEYVDLCWCCLLERIPSGSRFSPFYCPSCLELAHNYNRSMGRVLLYVGRHSLMNGVWVRGDEAARPGPAGVAAEVLGDFTRGLSGFLEAMDRWRPTRLQVVLRAIGRGPAGEGEPPQVGLVEYLQATDNLGDHPVFGKRAALGALCVFLGYPAVAEVN